MRRLTSLLLSAVMAFAFLFVPTMAHAVAPLPSLDGLVTDQAGVLGEDTAEIEEAQAAFHQATGGQFYVVFVDSFDDMDPDRWAEATAENANLTSQDILLVVSPDLREFRTNHGGDYVFTPEQEETLLATMRNSLGNSLQNTITWQAAVVNIIHEFQNEIANETTVQGTEPAPEGVQNDGATVDETTPAPAPTAPAATGGLSTPVRVLLIVLGALAALFALWLLLGKYNEKRLAKRAEQNPFNL